MTKESIERYNSMKNDKENGATYQEIAEKYNISRQRVHQILCSKRTKIRRDKEKYMNDVNFLTEDKLADYLGLSKLQARKLMTNESFPSFKIGNKWFVHKDKFDNFMTESKTVKLY